MPIRMGRGLAIALLAFATTSGVAVAESIEIAQADAQTLVNLWHKENSSCRGSGDEQACERRQNVGAQLDSKGYCRGKEGESGSQMEWHPCGPTSIRATPSSQVPTIARQDTPPTLDKIGPSFDCNKAVEPLKNTWCPDYAKGYWHPLFVLHWRWRH